MSILGIHVVVQWYVVAMIANSTLLHQPNAHTYYTKKAYDATVVTGTQLVKYNNIVLIQFKLNLILIDKQGL